MTDKTTINVLQIDIIGRCSNDTCRRGCPATLRDGYKFYLSFENSLCSDYVTEKFFIALNSKAVPVVLGAGKMYQIISRKKSVSVDKENRTFLLFFFLSIGGANYSAIAPEHSFIDAQKFSSPEELAKSLREMTEDEYLSYFWWKKHYSVVENHGWVRSV